MIYCNNQLKKYITPFLRLARGALSIPLLMSMSETFSVTFSLQYNSASLVPGPKAKASSLEITNPTSFTVSYQYSFSFWRTIYPSLVLKKRGWEVHFLKPCLSESVFIWLIFPGGSDDNCLQCRRKRRKVKLLSHVWLFVTPWTVAHQAPLSVGFSRQEYWSGLPFPSPGIFLTQGSNPGLPHCRQMLYCLSHRASSSMTQVQSLDQDDPLEKEKATHSSVLAWRIPWTEESGGLQSKASDTIAANTFTD